MLHDRRVKTPSCLDCNVLTYSSACSRFMLHRYHREGQDTRIFIPRALNRIGAFRFNPLLSF